MTGVQTCALPIWRFSVVVTGFSNTTTGAYNLYVDAPGAGCVVALAASASDVSLSGRVLKADGTGISGAQVQLTDGNGLVRTAISNGFGYYYFSEIPSGSSYVVGGSAKGYAFGSRVIDVSDSLADVDIIADQPGAKQSGRF